MIPRHIAYSIQEVMTQYPIISLTGPRQSGKTTLLRGMFPEYRYVNFEDPDSRLFFEQAIISLSKQTPGIIAR